MGSDEDRAKLAKIKELIDANIGTTASWIILDNIEAIIESKDRLKLEAIHKRVEENAQEKGHVKYSDYEYTVRDIRKILDGDLA